MAGLWLYHPQLTPQDLDPTYVLAFLGFLAAFAGGMELSQMTVKPRKLPWEKGQPPRWKGAIYSLAIVAIIVAGVLIVQALSTVFP